MPILNYKSIMLRCLPPWILGCITISLVVLNLFFWINLLFMMTFFKLIVPHQGWRNSCSRILELLTIRWTDGNNFIFWLTQKIEWKVQGVGNLDPKNSYLLISNHRNSIDIPGLQRIFNHRIPPLKFFIKQELIWIPFLGQAFWALDFPMMKRYTPNFLKKHPEYRGKDLETTRKACQKLKEAPFSIINFLEGTRFSVAKQQQQDSSYRYLLNPQFGTSAIILSNLKESITAILDITIVYPSHRNATFWDLVCGRVSFIVIHVRELPIPDGKLKPWIRELWEEKDRIIEQILLDYAAN